MSDFLSPTIATELESLIKAKDLEVEKGRRGVEVNGKKVNLIPEHATGESSEQGWTVVGPPHLQRYLSLLPSKTESAAGRLETMLRDIQALFQSNAFATLLACLTSLLPVAHTTNVRRFRPGLDYTLARGEPAGQEGDDEGEGPQAKLDVGLNLTPKQEKEEDQEIWEGGEAGAWDIWLVGDEGGDEATYGGGGGAAKEKSEEPKGDGEAPEGAAEQEEEMEEEEDSTLLSLEPTFNRLHLVLRDPGVLGFVKYVSAKAPGSRWDVNGEWDIRGIEEEEDGEGANEQ